MTPHVNGSTIADLDAIDQLIQDEMRKMRRLRGIVLACLALLVANALINGARIDRLADRLENQAAPLEITDDEADRRAAEVLEAQREAREDFWARDARLEAEAEEQVRKLREELGIIRAGGNKPEVRNVEERP